MQLVFLGVQPVEESAHSAPFAFAVDDGALLMAGQFIKRNVHRDALRFCETTQLSPGPIELRLGPRFNRAFIQTQTRIRNYQVEIEPDGVAKALTGWAGPERIIETEQARLRFRISCAVVFAFEAFGEAQAPRVVLVWPARYRRRF